MNQYAISSELIAELRKVYSRIEPYLRQASYGDVNQIMIEIGQALAKLDTLPALTETTTVPLLVRLQPESLRRLLVVRGVACPDEPWDKTIGDAIDIALERYDKRFEAVLRKKRGEPPK